MDQRLDVLTASPDLAKALYGVEGHLRRSVDRTLYELVKLRASMTNGCAFCIDMHSHDALEGGETKERLFGLAGWRDAPWYTPAERAALDLTDEVTALGPHGVTDGVWAEAARHFDERQLADLLGAMGMINLWNRISVSSRKTPLRALTDG